MSIKKTQNSKLKTYPRLRSGMQNGYTLLFAVLTATLVLGVAVFILGVSRKQLALSIAARDSMYSIYAADSGIECAAAAYWNGKLATSTLDGASSQSAFIPCNGIDYFSDWVLTTTPPVTILPFGWKPNSAYRLKIGTISIPLDSNNGACANISVLNGYDKDWKNVVLIESRGYNYCDNNGDPQINSRTVERALRLTYQ